MPYNILINANIIQQYWPEVNSVALYAFMYNT